MAYDAEINNGRLSGSRRILRVLLLGDPAERAQIGATLHGMTELRIDVSEAQNLASTPPTGPPPDVVMFVFDRQAPPQFTRLAGGAQPPAYIALTRDRSTHAIREALRAGADEVLFLPIDQEDLARALLKISESRSLGEAASKARLISLVSVTGGAGVTTIAANCGLALAHAMGKKVALVDLDFQAGDLAVALNIEPERTMRNLVDAHLRLNSVQVEAALTRHSSGVFLLGAPTHIEEGEQIPAPQVGEVLDVMRQMVDVVIVDLGRHIDDRSVVVWERSDELLYVIDQSIAAMRGAWRFLDLFGRLKPAALEPRFVLNRWTPRHPINEKQIADTLARPLLARIPRDDAALERTLAHGEDLWKAAPRSLLTLAFQALAHQVSGTAHHPKKTGFLSKMFARNGVKPGA